jgi:hypothetical protein
MSAILYGEIDRWPSKERMASMLAGAGLRVHVATCSIRLLDCSHFAFQEYGVDLFEPSIEADADTVEEMVQTALPISNALGRNGIRHRFEIYDESKKLAAYLHHDWPE